jgi:hypothetical protein
VFVVLPFLYSTSSLLDIGKILLIVPVSFSSWDSASILTAVLVPFLIVISITCPSYRLFTLTVFPSNLMDVFESTK